MALHSYLNQNVLGGNISEALEYDTPQPGKLSVSGQGHTATILLEEF